MRSALQSYYFSQKTNLMWISVYDRLLLELQLARVIATASDAHGAIMITINFSQYNVVNRSGDLTPLEHLTILKLQVEDTHGIKLN